MLQTVTLCVEVQWAVGFFLFFSSQVLKSVSKWAQFEKQKKLLAQDLNDSVLIGTKSTHFLGTEMWNFLGAGFYQLGLKGLEGAGCRTQFCWCQTVTMSSTISLRKSFQLLICFLVAWIRIKMGEERRGWGTGKGWVGCGQLSFTGVSQSQHFYRSNLDDTSLFGLTLLFRRQGVCGCHSPGRSGDRAFRSPQWRSCSAQHPESLIHAGTNAQRYQHLENPPEHWWLSSGGLWKW